MVKKQISNLSDGQYIEYWHNQNLIATKMETDPKSREILIDQIIKNLGFRLIANMEV